MGLRCIKHVLQVLMKSTPGFTSILLRFIMTLKINSKIDKQYKIFNTDISRGNVDFNMTITVTHWAEQEWSMQVFINIHIDE